MPITIQIDPDLPEGFHETANEDRTDDHDCWWFVPYIETYSPEREPYTEYVDRLKEWEGIEIETEAEYQKQEDQKQNDFIREFPEGIRYQVLCLDGGAWDRPTCKGTFSNQATALKFAEQLYQAYESHRH